VTTAMLDNCLVVGAILFVLGAVGFLTRRNLILVMLSAELMLHGVSLNLVAFSGFHENFRGQSFTVFILAIAACEAGIGLALTLALYRRRKTLDIDVWSDLAEVAPQRDEAAEEAAAAYEAQREDDAPEFPRLTPAGAVPTDVPRPYEVESRENASV
jgi:NADH-quinone oxidoreductase subunit K